VNGRTYYIPGNNWFNQRIYTEGVGCIMMMADNSSTVNHYCLKSLIKSGDTLYGPMPAMITMGIKEQTPEQKAGLIFPNPSINKIAIKMEGEGSVRILNASGQEVIIKQLNYSDEIDVSGLSEGIYLVKISSGDKSFSQKLVISR
jgi:hypothetical protein